AGRAPTAASSTSTTWPPCGSSRTTSSRTPTPSSCAGCGRAWSTACGWTTRTACATPRLTSAGCVGRPGRRGWGRRRCCCRPIACLPVYRTYASPARSRISGPDRAVLAETFGRARRLAPEIEADLLDFLHRVLLLEAQGPAEEELVERFQQTTGPVMAKGVEDTAFYSHLRLVALNEVGGDPGHFGVSPD